MPPILTTPRLYLRQFILDDAPLILQLNTPTVLKFVHESLPTSVEDAKQIIQNIILPQYELYQLGRFAVHVKEDNRFVGWCGLKYLQDENEIDLGYRFMEKEWGKGFATETAKACLQFGFEQRNLQKIIGRTHYQNIASQKVLQKIGLSFLNDSSENNIPIKIYTISKFNYSIVKNNLNTFTLKFNILFSYYITNAFQFCKFCHFFAYSIFILLVCNK